MWLSKNLVSKKAALLVLSSVLAFGVLTGCGKDKQAEADQTVVATYKDGGQVTRSDYDKFIGVNLFINPAYAQLKDDPQFQQEMLNQMLTYRIFALKADETTKKEAEEQTNQQIDMLKQMIQLQENSTLDAKLKEFNIAEADLAHYLKETITAFNGVSNSITEEQYQKEYDELLQVDKTMFDIATVSHILISTTDAQTNQELRTKEEALARAKEVRDKLIKGEDFAELAKQYSDDPGSKDTGGKYVDQPINQWVPGFKEATQTLPLNEVSEPVETSFGYHIIKVESRGQKTMEQAKEDLKTQITQETLYSFFEKELPNLILTNTLPKPENKATEPAGQPETTPNTDSNAGQ